MKKLFIIFSIFLASNALAAPDLWVDDPTDCPRSWNSVNCGSDYVCGVNSDTNFPACASESYMSAPLFTTQTNTSVTGSFGGGYLINCQETASGFDKHCTNSGNYWCNRDSSCSNDYRDTLCSSGSFGAFTCAPTCQGSRMDCDGDSTVGACNIIKNSTSFPVGSNNKYGTTCDAADAICSSGYTDCDGSGNGAGNGCEVRNNVTSYAANSVVNGSCQSVCNSGYVDCDASGNGSGTGCEVKYETAGGVSNPTSYNAAANNAFNASCQAICVAGFYDCDGSGIDGGSGCEVEADVTSYADNSTVNASCNSVCDAGYIDCDGSGEGSGNGCEVQTDVTSYADNSTVNGSCQSVCDAGYLDCDGSGPGVGDGCETLDGASCTLNGLQGTINGCSEGAPLCSIGPLPFMSGLDTEDATTDPLLWGSQYGSGKLIDIGKNGDSEAQFTVENDGRVGIGTDNVDSSAALEINSNNKGVKFPSMTTVERDAIANPSPGLFVFNTDDNEFNFYNGTEWTALSGGAAEQLLYPMPGSYLLE